MLKSKTIQEYQNMFTKNETTIKKQEIQIKMIYLPWIMTNEKLSK